MSMERGLIIFLFPFTFAEQTKRQEEVGEGLVGLKLLIRDITQG